MRIVRGAALTCRHVVELATDYLEDALSADMRAAVVRHLAACANCRAYIAQLRVIIKLTGRLRGSGGTAEALPQRRVDDLLQQYRRSRN